MFIEKTLFLLKKYIEIIQDSGHRFTKTCLQDKHIKNKTTHWMMAKITKEV